MNLSVNGSNQVVDAPGDTKLLWVIREHLRLTGTKFGCGLGLCGACTIHMNGEAVRSCQIELSDAEGTQITTIEGLGANGHHPVQKAWAEIEVPQCGYCQPGFIMATAAFLKMMPEPEDRMNERFITNICLSGTYNQVRAAIHRAAEIQMEEA